MSPVAIFRLLGLLSASAVAAQQPVHDWEFSKAGIRKLTGSIRGDGQLLEAPMPAALVFRGRDDRVVISRSIRRARLPRKALTIEAWVMLDAPRTWGGIFSAFQDNGGFEKGIMLGYRGDRFCFALATEGGNDQAGDGKLTYLTGRSAFTPGRFQHVVGVYDGTEMRLYVDGKREARSTTQKGPILYPRRAVVEIGAYHDDDEDYAFVGLIGRVRIFAAAFDDARVAREFAATRFAMPVLNRARSWCWTAARDGLEASIGEVSAQATGPVRFDVASGLPAMRFAGESSYQAKVAALPHASWSIETTFRLGGNRRRQSLAKAGGVKLSVLDGRIQFAIGDAVATIGDRLSPYRWHHAVATWDGSLLRLFLGGKPRAFARSRTSRVEPGDTLHIGREMQGELHEIAVTDRVLTMEQVQQRYAEKARLFPQPLTLELGPVARFTGPESARIYWRVEPGGAAGLEIVDTQGRLQRIAVRQEGGFSIADVAKLRPGLAYDYRIMIEGKDGKLRTTGSFRLDTDFAYAPYLPRGPRGQRTPLLDALPTRKGYAVVLAGAEPLTIELTIAMVRDTALQIVVVVPDRRAVQRLRQRFSRERLYGARVTVLHARFDAMPLGSDIANTVVVVTSDRVPRQELERITRPHGGVVLDPKGEVLLTKGGKQNAGEWTHQYGSAANTASSGDDLVGGELELQWFGRPGPRPMMDRGARSPAPLATNGRLFVHGDRRLLGLDAYNGTVLWALEIPALRRTNVPRDCSNIAAHGDHLFAAVVDRLWRIDAQTGHLDRSFEIPEQVRPDGDPAWGFVHVTDSLLLGTATTVHATYRGAEGEWYDKVGAQAEAVLGSALFALDPQSGELAWSRRGGMIVHPTLTVDRDTVFFVEDRKPSSQSRKKGRLVGQSGDAQFLVAVEFVHRPPALGTPV